MKDHILMEISAIEIDCQADYLCIWKGAKAMHQYSREQLNAFIASKETELQYQNPEFLLYRINPQTSRGLAGNEQPCSL